MICLGSYSHFLKPIGKGKALWEGPLHCWDPNSSLALAKGKLGSMNIDLIFNSGLPLYGMTLCE